MFFKILTAVLVIATVVVLPNFDSVFAQQGGSGLALDAQVRNLTRGENNFQDSTSAQSGDLVQIRIQVEAVTGQTGIVVRNPLPARLTFVSGATGMFNEGGIALGNMNGGNSQTLSFEATVSGTQEGPIVNTAFVRSRESAERSDSALVNAGGTVLGIQTPSLVLRNRAMNLTRGETVFQDSVDAVVGDRLRFEVYAESLAGNFQSGDRLAYAIPFGRYVIVSGDVNFILYGMELDGLRAGTPRIVTFEVVVNDSGTETKLVSTARVMSGQAVRREAAATVFVQPKGFVAVKNLRIDTRVQNLTRGETEFRDSTAAAAGDRVRVQIKIDAIGSTASTNVIVKNPLPPRLGFVSGDVSLISSSGLNLGVLSAGESKTAMFEAQVGSGMEPIVNTASVSSDNMASVSDSAQITISAVAGAAVASGQKTVTAVNRSLGQDATRVAARPGDVIAFQFTYRNTSGAPENVRVEADIKDVMTLARVSNTGGAVVDSGIIRFPAVNLAPNGEIIQTFEVTVFSASQMAPGADMIMTLGYGNQLFMPVNLVSIPAPAVAGTATIQPPRTGASANLAILFALLATGSYWLSRRKYQVKLV